MNVDQASPKSSPISSTPVSENGCEGANTETERVHFGPFQSPEKKFASKLGRRRRTLNPGSPVRYSARLSALGVPSPLRNHHLVPVRDNGDDSEGIEDEAAQRSRSGTPENDRFGRDEPSSVLADKIMHAYDNPSPPPQTRSLPDFIPSPAFDQDYTPPPTSIEWLNDQQGTCFVPFDEERPLAALLPALSLEDEPLGPFSREETSATPPANSSAKDLISFESDSTPSAQVQLASSVHGASILTASLSINPTTDELLRRPLTAFPSQVTELGVHNKSPESLLHHAVTSRKSPRTNPSRDSSPVSPSPLKGKSRENSRRFSVQDVNIVMSREQEIPQTEALISSALDSTDNLMGQFQTDLNLNNDTPTIPPLVSESPPQQLSIPPLAAQASKKGKERVASPEATGDFNGESLTICKEGGQDSSRGRTSSKESGDRPKEHSRRELRSLSPESTELLAQLFPSSKTRDVSVSTVTPSHKPISTEPTFPALPAQSIIPSTIQRPPVPKSPTRRPANTSPGKFNRFLDDPNRTPARRIPFEQAVTQGTVSPHKQKYGFLGIQPTNLSTFIPLSIFPRPAVGDPLRSPARRVLVSEALSTPAKEKPTSPVRRLKERERSRSAEDDHSMSAGEKGGPSGSRLASSSRPLPPKKLPFPIVPPPQLEASQGAGAEPVTVESPPVKTKLSTVTSSPVKSTLRQPSTGSRIPRIGTKPYARPVPSRKDAASSKAGKKPAGTASDVVKPMRVVEPKSNNSSDHPKSIRTGLGNEPRTKQTSQLNTSTNLKRKRTEQASPSRGIQPGAIARFPGSKQTPSISGVQLQNSLLESEKKPAPIMMRKVIGALEKQQDDVKDSMDHKESPTKRRYVRVEETDTFPSSSSNVSDPRLLASAPSPLGQQIQEGGTDSPAEASSPADSGVEGSMTKVRRTSRLRKTVQPASDVFGTVVERVPQPRRQTPVSRSEIVFAGMTATALKALTTSNTTKNQEYLTAKLETEVVRKEGRRPESPTVKVRTIVQKQNDEKDRQRKERAERRLRRSDEGVEESDRDDSDLMDDDTAVDGSPVRHTRGPGDEEGYETPVRRDRGMLGDERDDKERKRVKWDRGLSTAIYLDQIEPKPRPCLKEFVIKKGCLARTAKSLRLDTLGNILEADTPFIDFVHENVIVKKYIYDNEPDPNEPPPPVAKATRSKSKRLKT